MMRPTVEHMSELFNQIAAHVGLQRFKFQLYARPDMPNAFFASASTELPGIVSLVADTETPRAYVERVLQPVLKDIAESAAVQSELSELRSRATKAEAQVERMKPFEEYYRMHFTMTHGKKLDVIA